MALSAVPGFHKLNAETPGWMQQFLIQSHWESSGSRFSLQSQVTFSCWINGTPSQGMFPEAQAGTQPWARGQGGAFSKELVGDPNSELPVGKAEGNRLGRNKQCLSVPCHMCVMRTKTPILGCWP